jgi:hypothetical protein
VVVWGIRDPATARDAFEELLRRQITVHDTEVGPG